MMQQIDISGAGALGFYPDIPPSEAPLNAWSTAQNVRCHEGEAVAFPGHEIAVKNTNISDLWALLGATTPASHYWVNFGPAQTGGALQAWAYDGSTFHAITNAGGWSGTQADIITGDILNQNVVFTNGADLPQFWPMQTGTPFADLTGWDANWRCGVIRAHKGFLIACDMLENGTRYPYRVRWSNQAAPGGLPPDWDANDPASLAGFQDLGDTSSFLIGALPLRDQMLLYTENETIGMQFIGGDFRWRFHTISRQSGLLAKRAVVSLRGRHLVMTDNDVVAINGQQVESIIDNRARHWLFNSIDPQAANLSYAVANTKLQEVWFCFPTEGSTYCNRAWLWNMRDNTSQVRDLPEGNKAAGQVLDIVGTATLTWATNPFNWNTWTQTWGRRSYDPSLDVVLLGGTEASGGDGAPLMRTEVGNQFNGQPRTMRIERVGMRLTDSERVVTLHEVWPRAVGGPVTIRVGASQAANGPVAWQAERTFTPGVDRKITCRVSGRYPAIGFISTDPQGFKLQGYSLKFREGAQR